MLVAVLATTLVVSAMGCGLAGKVQNIVGTAKAVGEYSDKLMKGEKLTYTAEYKVDGGDTVTLTQQPPNSAFISKSGRFIFTPTAMYLCSTENSVLACQKSVPTSGDLTPADAGLVTAVAGQAFISPTLALGLILAASVAPGAKVSQSTKTVAGQSSSCLTASNLDAAQSPGTDGSTLKDFTVCVTDAGVLASFTGSDTDGVHKGIEMTSFKTTADAASFAPPPGAKVTDVTQIDPQATA
jgi:hypothetical protein